MIEEEERWRRKAKKKKLWDKVARLEARGRIPGIWTFNDTKARTRVDELAPIKHCRPAKGSGSGLPEIGIATHCIWTRANPIVAVKKVPKTKSMP